MNARPLKEDPVNQHDPSDGAPREWATPVTVVRVPHVPERLLDAVRSLRTVKKKGVAPAWLNPPQGEDELGRLGGYRVLRPLGEGGMGLVFEAEDALLRRKVALKVMQPTLAAAREGRDRFLREARAAAAIEHEHLITLYQVGEDNGVLFLAMPLLHGESLDDRLEREGKLPIPELVRLARETAEGLAAAHAGGLIHRDIKPANIFLERPPNRNQCRVKILDFGLARSVDVEASVLTKRGQVIGTPGYMAPEQAQCQPLDARCDLFSLGCVIHHMAAGQEPFHGSTPLNVLVAVMTDPVPPLTELRREVPAALSELVQALLSKSPDGRPATAAAVAERLAAIEASLNGGGSPAPPPPAAPAPLPSSEAPTVRAPRSPAPLLLKSKAPPAAPSPPPPRREAPAAIPSGEWKTLPDLPAPLAPAGDTAKPPADPPTDETTKTSVNPPAAPTPAPVTANGTACSECRTDLRVLGGKRWCLRCGLCYDLDPEAQVAPAPPPPPAMPTRYLAVGIGALFVFTVALGLLLF